MICWPDSSVVVSPLHTCFRSYMSLRLSRTSHGLLSCQKWDKIQPVLQDVSGIYWSCLSLLYLSGPLWFNREGLGASPWDVQGRVTGGHESPDSDNIQVRCGHDRRQWSQTFGCETQTRCVRKGDGWWGQVIPRAVSLVFCPFSFAS